MFAVGAPASPNDASMTGIPRQIASKQAREGEYNTKVSEALYSFSMNPEAESECPLWVKSGRSDESK
jgi:hypothetical protein